MPNRNCECGNPLEHPKTGRRRKWCTECRPSRVGYVARNIERKPACDECKFCGKRSFGRKFCSDSCKWKARPRKTCAECGSPTGWCLLDRRAQAAVVCNSCRRKKNQKLRVQPQPLTWSCLNCGKISTRPPTKGQVPKYCGISCAQLAAFHRRRSRLVNAFVEDVNRVEVFMADGWRCHLCGKLTDKTKSYPHPKSPTIDHVIPINRGGLHERSNCRTACARCNSAKQDRGGGEQFAFAF